MKKLTCIIAFFVLALLTEKAYSQIVVDTSATYIVVKADGSELIGKIISNDAYQVIIETKTIGQVAISKSTIKEIRVLNKDVVKSKGDFESGQVFATRYFLTTNGLPVKKGDIYALIHIFGPEIHYGVTDDFSIGIMSSWLATPIVFDAKYSMKLADNFHLGIGALLGTGSWTLPDFYMALPFGAATIGDRKNNITVSGGYGIVGYGGTSSGQTLYSIAGMATITKTVTLVFDSFILPSDGGSIVGGSSILIPGLRLQSNKNAAFQVGFARVAASGFAFPLPILGFFMKL